MSEALPILRAYALLPLFLVGLVVFCLVFIPFLFLYLFWSDS